MKNLLHPTFLSLLLVFACLMGCSSKKAEEETLNEAAEQETLPSLESISEVEVLLMLDSMANRSTLVIETLKNPRLFTYNSIRAAERFIPASTFKIPHTMIALEEGAVADENEVFEWDDTDHGSEGWNQDQTLASAYKRSAAWVYRKITERIDSEIYQQWLQKSGYGNADPTGGDFAFWIDGNLSISAIEQITFLQALDAETLPFSPATFTTTKDVMIEEQTDTYTLRAKTGWARGNPDIGWYVGYLETPDETYYFAFNLSMLSDEEAAIRKQFIREVFQTMGVMP